MNNLLYDDFELWLKTGIEFNKFKNKTFMVTGATGLIGSLIIKTLLYLNKEKHLNTKIIGVIRNVSKARKIYGDLTYDDKLSFTVSDLAKDKINLDEHIDFLVHAASVTTSRYLVESPVESFDVAINGTQRVLEFAKEKEVSKVIYISSMEVYGNLNLDRMATEDDLGYIDLKNVRSVYSEGKRICELLCKAYVSEYDMNIVSARLAQTFGAVLIGAFFPFAFLSQLISAGTLISFMFVCLGIYALRRREGKDIKDPDFKMPLYPVMPFLGFAAALFVFLGLSHDAKLYAGFWFLAGLIIYFVYGINHSALSQKQK